MADTPVTLPTKEELAQLPVRAIVAYAARCARRVEPLFVIGMSKRFAPKLLKKWCQEIDSAIAVAASFCRSSAELEIESVRTAMANAAATASAADAASARAQSIQENSLGVNAKVAAFAARSAASAAELVLRNLNAIIHLQVDVSSAIDAAQLSVEASKDVVPFCRRDFDLLKAMRYQYDDFVDDSDAGVCGKVWGEHPPDWYTEGLGSLRSLQVLKKSASRRRVIQQSPSVDRDTEVQELKRERDNVRLERDSLEGQLKSLQLKQADLNERLDRADGFGLEQLTLRQHEEARHEKTREEVQNLQNARRELQEQLNASQSRIADHELELLKVRGQLAQVQQKSEVLQVQSLWWYWEKFFCPKSMFQLMALIVLGAMVMFALFGIGEVYERQALDRWIKSQVETQRERLVDRGPVERPSSNRLESLEAIRSQLLILSLAGASTRDETIAGVRDELKSLQLESTGLPPVPSVAMGPPGWWPWFPYQSSDLLLSLVVLFSGTVGAVITTLRRDKPLTLRDLGHGLAAGFITFLAVRGGKSVFLLDADPLLLINPYNSAFFGLLAGMFTELAYGLLSSLAEEMSGRLQSAFSAPKESLDRPRPRSSDPQTPREGSSDTTSQSS